MDHQHFASGECSASQPNASEIGNRPTAVHQDADLAVEEKRAAA
jgi:hypothetical protein